MSKQVVLITGISGYLGSKVTQHFLNDGTYEVRGTVRSATNEKKVAPLKAAFGDKFDSLKLIEADLMKPETMKKAIEGCDIVVHTASVFTTTGTYDQVVKPAVEGTKAVLEGCREHKVKRLVVTSSCVAIHSQATVKPSWTENDWSDESFCTIYDLSKTLAEKACWDFQAKLPEAEKFDIVTINPGVILGKYLVKSNFQSADIIYDLLNGALPKMDLMFCGVDIDDCANAHLQAVKVAEARNNRFICAHAFKFGDMHDACKAKYPNYPIKMSGVPSFMLSLVGCLTCNQDAKFMASRIGKQQHYDNSKLEKILGIKLRNCVESSVEMAEQIIDDKYVKATK